MSFPVKSVESEEWYYDPEVPFAICSGSQGIIASFDTFGPGDERCQIAAASLKLLAACRKANRFLSAMAERGMAISPGQGGITEWCEVQQELAHAILSAVGSVKPSRSES